MNKRLLPLSGIILCFISGLSAQSDTLKHPEQFLFSEFSRGRVSMKTGINLDLLLNYNIISEKMVFVQNGEILGLGNPGSVDTVYILDKKLVPVGKAFFVVLTENPMSVFIQYKGSFQQPPKMDSYGRASEASSVTSVNSLKVGKEFYTLTDQEIVIKREIVYWIRLNSMMQSFRDANQLIKIFPDYKSDIRLYIKQNKTKFSNTDEVLKLAIYCKGLMKGA
jgi:hypothetical protein